jgi:CTP:molybdopterin cytidylyltransferase MocA
VVNPDYAAGQSSSLRAGLAALEDGPAEAAVILLGDQPLVGSEAVRAVAQAFRETGASVVRARYGARIGHPILLARRVWPAARGLQGDVGARGLIRDLAELEPQRVHDVELPGPAPEDIDTPEQYEQLRQARS